MHALDSTAAPPSRAHPDAPARSSRLHARIDGWLARYAARSVRHAATITALALLAFLLGVPGTALLYGELHTDLRELLPQGAPAARGLDELEQRLGGLSHLAVVVHTDDFAQGARFVDALAARLQALPKALVARVDYRVDEERAWYDAHGVLYAHTEELAALRDALIAQKKSATRRANPLLVDLSDDDAAPAPKSDAASPASRSADAAATSDLAATSETASIDPALRRQLDKLSASFAKLDRFPGGYLAGEGGHTLVLLLTPSTAAVSLEEDRRMVDAVQEQVALTGPASFSPSIRVGYGGEVITVIEAQESLVRDLMLSSILVLVLVSLAIVLYYRTLRAIPLLVGPLFAGITLNFALARLLIHYLNPNTAFLGSIIVGNGINPGIILLARIFEEQRRKRTMVEALRIALQETWPATLTASAAAAASYGTLIFISFRGFNQFGLMGLFGMILCWLATYLAMPAMVALLERWRPLPLEGKGARPAVGALGTWYARHITQRAGPVLLATSLLIAISLFAIERFARDPVLYDFTKLSSREGIRTGAASQDAHVDAVLQSYQTPTVVLTDSPDEARRVEQALGARTSSPQSPSTIASVDTLSALLPAEQPQKLALLREIFAEMTPALLARLPAELRPLVERLRSKSELREVTLAEVPAKLQRAFREKDGTSGKLVLVYPTLAADAHHGRAQVAHAKEVRALAQGAVPTARVAGQIVLTADIVSVITHDGVVAGMLSFLAVALLTLLAMRSLRHSLWVIGPLCLGVLWMFGALGLFGIQFNFVNFSVLPITFGIGVDYAVNLYERVRHTDTVEEALAASGGAVALCSSTTMIGYAVLLVADNQAISSFGLTAVIGELTCLLAALFALPALLAWRAQRAHAAPAL